MIQGLPEVDMLLCLSPSWVLKPIIWSNCEIEVKQSFIVVFLSCIHMDTNLRFFFFFFKQEPDARYGAKCTIIRYSHLFHYRTKVIAILTSSRTSIIPHYSLSVKYQECLWMLQSGSGWPAKLVLFKTDLGACFSHIPYPAVCVWIERLHKFAWESVCVSVSLCVCFPVS